MTRVSASPDTEEDVSAEQVAAYARCVCGHRKNSHRGATNRGSCKATIHTYGAHDCPCSRFLDATSRKGLAALAEQAERARRNIERDDEAVARAEQRHPSDVLADITGPARGVEGRRCAPRTGEWFDPCMCRFLPTADECSAPHGAQEESE